MCRDERNADGIGYWHEIPAEVSCSGVPSLPSANGARNRTPLSLPSIAPSRFVSFRNCVKYSHLPSFENAGKPLAPGSGKVAVSGLPSSPTRTKASAPPAWARKLGPMSAEVRLIGT